MQVRLRSAFNGHSKTCPTSTLTKGRPKTALNDAPMLPASRVCLAGAAIGTIGISFAIDFGTPCHVKQKDSVDRILRFLDQDMTGTPGVMSPFRWSV